MGNYPEAPNNKPSAPTQPLLPLQPIIEAKPPNKTAFFYLKPIPLPDDIPEEEDSEPKESKVKIEEIKVKWMSFLKMKEGSFLH